MAVRFRERLANVLGLDLRDGGFDGIAVYEMCSPVRGGGSLENLDACAGKYLQWLRENQFEEPTVDRSEARRPALTPASL